MHPEEGLAGWSAEMSPYICGDQANGPGLAPENQHQSDCEPCVAGIAAWPALVESELAEAMGAVARAAQDLEIAYTEEQQAVAALQKRIAAAKAEAAMQVNIEAIIDADNLANRLTEELAALEENGLSPSRTESLQLVLEDAKRIVQRCTQRQIIARALEQKWAQRVEA